MADQTQRLEIATVRAEVGSNILFRFANDAAAAGPIPTDSGDIPNLKQVIIEIQTDASDKISIATTIYQTAAAGLAATADGGIFLVQSSDADTIYTVWQNQAGAAVNTGKTAMSSQAIQDALTASNEAAQAAEDAADVATNRTAGFLQPAAEPPTVRDDGLPLQVGDRYFNTESETEYLFKDGAWVSNDSLAAIAELEASITEHPTPNGTPKAGDDGKIDFGWIPDQVATAEELDWLQENYQQYKTDSDRTLMGTSMDQRTMFRRRLVADFPMKGAQHDAIIAAQGYAYLYPQGFVIDKSADQIIINYGRSGGSNEWCWLYVYKLSTKQLLTVVTPEYNFNETMVIRYENGTTYSEENFTGATRYLYASADYGLTSVGGSNLIRMDLTSIESKPMLSSVKSIATLPYPSVQAYSFIAWTGREWVVQRIQASRGRRRRHLFDRWSSNFSAIVGSFSTVFGFTGDVGGDYYATSPKAQGFAIANGKMYTAFGAPFSFAGSAANNDPKAAQKMYGICSVNPDGSGLESALCQADGFINTAKPFLGYEPTQVEAEGMCANLGKLYTLFVMLSTAAPGDTKGIAIFEEMSSAFDAIDFSKAAVIHRGFHNEVATQIRVHNNAASQLRNPVTGDALTTYLQIANMVLGLDLSTYKFAGNGQLLTDINGASVTTTNKLFEFTGITADVVFLKITGATSQESYYITPSVPSQVPSGFTVAIDPSAFPITSGYTAVNAGSLGKTQSYRSGNGALAQYEFYNLNPAGTAKQLAGYITCNNTTTSYVTTSDVELKDDCGWMDAETALDLVQSIKWHRYTWKSTGVQDYGVFAQELHEIYPAAVVVGGWDGEDGEPREHYMPWGVDYSKLVVPIGRALQAQIKMTQLLQDQVAALLKRIEGLESNAN
jgi:hypothetical protein